jgi:hypothetical protein
LQTITVRLKEADWEAGKALLAGMGAWTKSVDPLAGTFLKGV